MVMKLHRKEHVEFERFRNDDFDARDKECPEQSKKFEDFELQELLDENPAQMLLELSKALNVIPKVVSKRLHVMEKIYKKGICLPHELLENRILNRLLRLLCLPGKEKRIFCGVS